MDNRSGFKFEKLIVWQKSMELGEDINRLSENFPQKELYNLSSQIRRAAVSITSNIAEGSSRISGKEQARFTEIAYGSLLEVLNQLILAVDFEYIEDAELNKQRPLIEEIANKLNKLRQSQLNRGEQLNS